MSAPQSRIFLVRHAWPVVQPDRPQADWPLSAEGRASALSIGFSLRAEGIARVRGSTERKAADTAAAIAEALGAPCDTDADLGEVGGRNWVETDYHAAVERFFASPSTSSDGWETATDATTRFTGAMDRFVRTLAGRAGLVVGHGLVLALYMAAVGGRTIVDPADWRAIRMPDLAIVQLPAGVIERPFGAPTPYHP